MSTSRTSRVVGSLVVAVSLLSGCSGDDEPEVEETTTTAQNEQVTASMGSTEVLGVDPQFATFLELAELAELGETLDSTEDLTILAPHSDVFDEVDENTLDQLKEDPTGALAERLEMHLIGETLRYQDLVNMHGATIETLAGATLVVSSVNGEIRIGGAKITKSDIETDNAVIHVMGALVDPDARIEEQPDDAAPDLPPEGEGEGEGEEAPADAEEE